MRTLITSTLLLNLAILAGCDQSAQSPPPAKPAASAASTPAAPDSALPPGLWLSAAPAGAKPVGEIKKNAAAGQDVVLFGRIGGSRDPFVSGRAMFTLVDRSVPSCTDRHGDGCPTPWDYCCEPRENLLANTVTIQVLGADGKPARVALADSYNLKPLAEVTVTGKVSSAGANVLIDAHGIFVKK